MSTYCYCFKLLSGGWTENQLEYKYIHGFMILLTVLIKGVTAEKYTV